MYRFRYSQSPNCLQGVLGFQKLSCRRHHHRLVLGHLSSKTHSHLLSSVSVFYNRHCKAHIRIRCQYIYRIEYVLSNSITTRRPTNYHKQFHNRQAYQLPQMPLSLTKTFASLEQCCSPCIEMCTLSSLSWRNR